jgi:transforming growth factor-beta-induced protein
LNGNVNLVITNVFASNGVIHVIDAVLVPPAPEESESNTIVDIVEGDDRFETLLAALQLTGLDETLSGEGPFTVFAPTDDAFDALPMDVLDALLANPDALAEVLLYHVVLDELLAEEVVSRHSLTSALGPRITVQGNQLTLNGDVNLIVTDVIADNGVIHVIDKVLVPPSH